MSDRFDQTRDEQPWEREWLERYRHLIRPRGAMPEGLPFVPVPDRVPARRRTLRVDELIALLAQLPPDAEVRVEGDEIVPPRLLVGPPERDVCLLDPNHGMVDHIDGKILR